MTEPSETPQSMASPETQRRVAELEVQLASWRAVMDYEHGMALLALTDNEYHISGRHAEDRRCLDELRRFAEEA